ncbi:2'-5' RNA ligase family protein (plasmid) [Streptomyces sp. NBC_00161]|uniref:2'-5' RNA ligase family protein n=1 Tax=Streptomyces sp. NBC_00161 TaxID=2975671 RepID=UPI002F9125A0
MDDFFAAVESRPLAWPRGRGDLHWLITFPPRVVEETLTAPYRELSSMPGLEPVPAEWMHLTLLHAGPEDQYTPEEIARVIELFRMGAASVPPFDVEFSRPSVGKVALEMAGRPGAPSRRLWEIATQAFEEVAPKRWPLIPEHHAPHMSIAYGSSSAAKANPAVMKVWLSDHGPGPVTLRAEKAVLVSERHDGARITWTHLAEVPLGAAS